MELEQITGELERRAGVRAIVAQARPVGGGSINRAYYLPTDRGALFVKTNAASALAMFEAEAEGLAALRGARAVAVPGTIGLGRVAGTAYLALGWVELAAKTAGAERCLAAGLARQHRVTAEQFGWHRDNTIGSTPQHNAPTGSWIDFLGRHRLGFQLELAAERGLPRRALEQGHGLVERLESFFPEGEPPASLLHGDLWAGNWGCDADGTPYVFDPAVYYGDREADLAMTRLFGGFGGPFYSAYQEEWPLTPGWERRVDLYNLYHLLNHYNLFGAGYLGQVTEALARLIHA